MGIKAKNIAKTIENPVTKILCDINLEISEGDFISLTGKSGSGKSTLLYLLSTLDNPSSGTIEIDDKEVEQMNEEEVCDFRNKKAGFVFQFHYLISELNTLENVLLPSKRDKYNKAKKNYALHLLEQFGLEKLLDRLPRQLSGGEAQRVAVARSLIMQPKYIFADEPTGSLDTTNGELIMKMLLKANEELNTTVILVTHDTDFANLAKRQIYLIDGKICCFNGPN